MQFLPPIFSDSNVSAMGGVSVPPQVVANGNTFLESLNSELAASGIKPVMDVSVDSGGVNGFRTVNRDPGNKLDSEDLEYMKKAAKKRGLDEGLLEGFEGPLTIGNLLGHVSASKRAGEELTEEEYTLISGALAKMGLGQEDIEEIIGMMDNGDGFGALATIKKAMGDAEFALNRDEVNALVRGLGLSEDTAKKMAALFGEGETRSLGKESFAELFGPATSELADKKKAREDLAKEMRAIIEEALEAKQKRAVIAPVADTRGSRQAERAETRMVEDLTAKGRDAVSRNDADLSHEDSETSVNDFDEAFEEEARQKGDNARETAAETLANPASGRKQNAAESGTSSARDGLSSVFSRLDATSSGMAGAGTLGAQTLHNPQPGSAAEHAALARKQDIFAQVEQGMLRQMADGSTKMTLRLDPADLGQVSLLLTVKNGEVRALIRAENPETTAALTEQMAQLRASLEEQGLKVASLDVETQLPQDAATRQWSDTAQFNQEQEMREQARFARLARIRREAGTTLAQDMQSSDHGEEISSPNGLHIIA